MPFLIQLSKLCRSKSEIRIFLKHKAIQDEFLEYILDFTEKLIKIYKSIHFKVDPMVSKKLFLCQKTSMTEIQLSLYLIIEILSGKINPNNFIELTGPSKFQFLELRKNVSICMNFKRCSDSQLKRVKTDSAQLQTKFKSLDLELTDEGNQIKALKLELKKKERTIIRLREENRILRNKY